MDWMTVILFVLVSSVSTGVVVAYNMRQVRQPLREHKICFTKYELPPPGQNLDLYRRVTALLDEISRERDAALTESAELKRGREALVAEQERLGAKLEAARDILRQWSHQGMNLRFLEPQSTEPHAPERKKIVVTL